MKPVISGLKEALIFKHSAIRALAARVSDTAKNYHN